MGNAECRIVRGGEASTACGREFTFILDAGEGMLVIPQIKEVK